MKSWLASALLLLLLASAVLAPFARADATPVQLVLLYMPNVSNTGTASASGIAELLMPEGEVRVTAADLPRLDGDRRYVAWVVNTGTNEFQRLGAFNSAESTKAVHFEDVLPGAIADNHWNLLLLTVEDNANAVRPSTKHSIAGVFPRADNEPLPGLLPNTGGADEVLGVGCQVLGVGCWESVTGANWLHNAGLAALALALGAAAGYALGKRRGLRDGTNP